MALRLLCAALVLAAGASAITLKKEAARKRAPDFELKDASGAPVKLSDYAGKVVLLDFWATWCAPCKESIPWFNELHETYGPKGFAVIGVSMDESWDVLRPFMEKTGVRYPVVLGTKRVAYLYGDVEELPLAFFIDRAGRVAAIHLGDASRKGYEKTIKALLAAP